MNRENQAACYSRIIYARFTGVWFGSFLHVGLASRERSEANHIRVPLKWAVRRREDVPVKRSIAGGLAHYENGLGTLH